ncbi:hypothetical protein MTBLM1_30019 [Rhodospirillaceae bacterium LM-1]|nr:hypothetical protein MTBLM1_30019 [Rhodospirillaceae bacterium LM-1]
MISILKVLLNVITEFPTLPVLNRLGGSYKNRLDVIQDFFD